MPFEKLEINAVAIIKFPGRLEIVSYGSKFCCHRLMDHQNTAKSERTAWERAGHRVLKSEHGFVTTSVEAGAHTLKTKAEIAEYYQIGLRTVTMLMHRRILPYRKIRNLVRFDTSECDSAFDYFAISSAASEFRKGDGIHQAQRLWKTKRQIADHYHISERTVTNLMQQSILPYTKLGRLVRFDLVLSGRVFEAFKIESIVEHRHKS